MSPRTLAMSPSGRFVALRRPGAVEIVDVLGTSPRQSHALDGGDFTIAGTTLCLLDAGGLRTIPLEGAAAPATVAITASALRPFRGRTADAVLADGTTVTFAGQIAGRVDARCIPLHGRAVLVMCGNRVAFAAPSRAGIELQVQGAVVDAAPLFGGRLYALLVRELDGDAAVVITSTGRLVHRVAIAAATWHAFAAERGLLLAGRGDAGWVAIDLRYGQLLGEGEAPHAIAELAIDDDARMVALAGPSDGDVPVVSLLRFDELLQARAPAALPVPARLPAPFEEVAPVVAPASTGASEAARDAPSKAAGKPANEPANDAANDAASEAANESAIDAASDAASKAASKAANDAASDPTNDAAINAPLPDLVPLALGAPRTPRAPSTSTVEPYADAGEHLGALLDLVAARTVLAIAEGWHAGRISSDAVGRHPFEREVLALAGAGGGHAPEHMLEARVRLATRARIVGLRVEASRDLPFVELCDELGLSQFAAQLLVAILAPCARGELARLYRILGNETNRATCDEALLAHLLAGCAPRVHDAIAAELADSAPLVRFGLVTRGARGGLEVDDALLARLRGLPPPTSPATRVRMADRTAAELVVDRGALRAVIEELARPSDTPLGLVLRGRRGAGRHTTIATLAARVDRTITCIDASQLPARELAEALRKELARAAFSRSVPVVSGLEQRDGSDAAIAQQVRHVLAAHPGPIVLRTSDGLELPLDPGFVDVTLPALGETARAAAFAQVFGAHAIDADALAQRYRIGPGTITSIAREVVRRRTGDGDVTALADEVARQHVAARIGSAAQRVTRLATWDQVALPDDMLDSLRELVGRARHGRTVFDAWGYDQRITSARGLTALFYGPPGTGKTMVAGLIARELGLELYRVDLAKIMSKWVGETEKNLGEVFDAAEDGRLMLLFDEADSLFAKRSEVKSANDRYANLEVNYLLQRLDAFEGVAVLTTNLEGSIDPAFKRRLSMRLYFPFPDEDLRAQLWAAHVTPQIPTAGPLDFGALARRFPLSGGYIRNSALRAAFLAAQERTPLTQAHLVRAVLLEYRELGKLANDGRLD